MLSLTQVRNNNLGGPQPNDIDIELYRFSGRKGWHRQLNRGGQYQQWPGVKIVKIRTENGGEP